MSKPARRRTNGDPKRISPRSTLHLRRPRRPLARADREVPERVRRRAPALRSSGVTDEHVSGSSLAIRLKNQASRQGASAARAVSFPREGRAATVRASRNLGRMNELRTEPRPPNHGRHPSTKRPLRRAGRDRPAPAKTRASPKPAPKTIRVPSAPARAVRHRDVAQAGHLELIIGNRRGQDGRSLLEKASWPPTHSRPSSYSEANGARTTATARATPRPPATTWPHRCVLDEPVEGIVLDQIRPDQEQESEHESGDRPRRSRSPRAPVL